MRIEVDNDHCISICAQSDSDQALIAMWQHMSARQCGSGDNEVYIEFNAINEDPKLDHGIASIAANMLR